MVFLRAFTIFIVCISISRIIISISGSDENKDNLDYVHVRAWGYLNCTPCKDGKEVLINLKMNGKSLQNTYYGNCKKPFIFYINTENSTSFYSDADFFYYCYPEEVKKIFNKRANCRYFYSHYGGFWDCRFGVVQFDKSKKRTNRKRRNRRN